MEKLADAEAKCDVTSIVQLQGAIKFNGGGHLNHSIFWKVQYKQWISNSLPSLNTVYDYFVLHARQLYTMYMV